LAEQIGIIHTWLLGALETLKTAARLGIPTVLERPAWKWCKGNQHITMLHQDRALLERLRAAFLRTAREINWTAAGAKLLDVYRDKIEAQSAGVRQEVGEAH